MKKKGYITFIVGIIMTAMLVIGLPVTALAADAPAVTMPVTIELEGVLPAAAEEYKILLTADDPTYPMPSGSIDGMYTLAKTGAGTAELPAISYPKLGVYTYTIKQLPGTNANAAYDPAVYSMTVYVTNAEDGSGLEATVAMHLQGSSAKPEKVVFKNKYTAPPVDLTVRKVWVDNGKNRPTSVNVSLYNGDKVVETVRLDASNKWTYTWKGLAGDGAWDVKESAVPKGYKVSYSTANGTVTVTNTASLIQTGQLNWPIYLLGGLGILLVAAGIFMTIKKRTGDHGEE